MVIKRFLRLILYLSIILSLLGSTLYFQLPKVDTLPVLVQTNVRSHGATYVSLSQVPPILQKAIIDTEDKSFYTNSGISFEGIGRSVLTNLKSGKYAEGASTLTQQLVRAYYLSSEKTMTRKVKEMALAIIVTRNYSKEEILEMYLNTVYFGHGAWGINSAARVYFSKSLGELNPAQCTLLAGLPQAPSYYDPFINIDAARDRQTQVLQCMAQEGDLSQSDVTRILNMSLGIK